MPKIVQLKNAAQINAIKEQGYHAVGAGLYIEIREHSRAWVARVTASGKRSWRVLGDARQMPLATARDKVGEKKREPIVSVAALPTFNVLAETYIARKSKAGEWTNAKSEQQWTNTLATYAAPVIGKKPIDAITVGDIIEVFDRIGHRHETRDRVRGRIENIIDFGFTVNRPGAPYINPASTKILQNVPGVKMAKPTDAHHAAVPFADVPGVFAELKEKRKTHVTYAALSFAVVTATRSIETRGMRWGEVDLAARTWAIPAGRMKAREEYRVPLSDEALRILAERAFLQEIDTSKSLGDLLVFPSPAKGVVLSDMALLSVVRRVAPGMTAHGFRSSFRDWAAANGTEHVLAEMCLAHAVLTKVERAYLRGDQLERRRGVLEDWGRYLAG